MTAQLIRASSLHDGVPYAYASIARPAALAFGDHDVPSTLLGVAALGYDGQLVEIEAVAEQPPVPPRPAPAG